MATPGGGNQSQGLLTSRPSCPHKSLSPLQTLGFWAASPQVLETCMKSCGKRFHDEVGKFRFLNELIKVVSPKVGAPSPSSALCRLMGDGLRLLLGPPSGARAPPTASAPIRNLTGRSTDLSWSPSHREAGAADSAGMAAGPGAAWYSGANSCRECKPLPQHELLRL